MRTPFRSLFPLMHRQLASSTFHRNTRTGYEIIHPLLPVKKERILHYTSASKVLKFVKLNYINVHFHHCGTAKNVILIHPNSVNIVNSVNIMQI